MGRWCGPALRHAPAIWVEKGNGTPGPVSAQTLSMSQLLRWKWNSEKSFATGTHNSELQPDGSAPRLGSRFAVGTGHTALKTAKPIQFKENIALVLKYFDQLAPLVREQDSNLRPAD